MGEIASMKLNIYYIYNNLHNSIHTIFIYRIVKENIIIFKENQELHFNFKIDMHPPMYTHYITTKNYDCRISTRHLYIMYIADYIKVTCVKYLD